MAWFSSVTHLSGLSILRYRLQDHLWQRTVRIGLMFALVLMLIVALVTTGYFAWEEIPAVAQKSEFMASAATCYFNINSGVYHHWESVYRQSSTGLRPGLVQSASMQSAVMSTALLTFGFFTRASKLFHPLCKSFQSNIRQPLSISLQAYLDRLYRWCQPIFTQPDIPACKSIRHRIWMVLLVQPVLAYFLTFRLCIDLFSSMLAEVGSLAWVLWLAEDI